MCLSKVRRRFPSVSSARGRTGGGEVESGCAAAPLGQKGQSVGQLHATDWKRQEGEEGEAQRSALRQTGGAKEWEKMSNKQAHNKE